jgi:hypothetical protein
MNHIIRFTDEELDALHEGTPPWEINIHWDAEKVITSLVALYKVERHYANRIGEVLADEKQVKE